MYNNFAHFECHFVLSEIEAVVVKTSSVVYADSSDQHVLKICLKAKLNKCCTFTSNGFKRGNLDLFEAGQLETCAEASVSKEGIDVSMTTPGTDGWRGEYVQVVMSDKRVKCNVPKWLDDKKTINLTCTAIQPKGGEIFEDAQRGVMIKISKVLVKTSDKMHAGSNDAFKGQICGLNGKCCLFNIEKNSLVKGGKLEIPSKNLGGCMAFQIDTSIKSIILEKIGDDTWIGESVQVVLQKQSSTRETLLECSVKDQIGKNGKAAIFCDKGKDRVFLMSKVHKIFKMISDEGNECYDNNINYEGNDKMYIFNTNTDGCQKACETEPICNYWSLKKDTKTCILKDVKTTGYNLKTNFISGPKTCQNKGRCIIK